MKNEKVAKGRIIGLAGPCFYNSVTNGKTDGRTDGRTNRPTYRDARTHLKMENLDTTETWKVEIQVFVCISSKSAEES